MLDGKGRVQVDCMSTCTSTFSSTNTNSIVMPHNPLHEMNCTKTNSPKKKTKACIEESFTLLWNILPKRIYMTRTSLLRKAFPIFPFIHTNGQRETRNKTNTLNALQVNILLLYVYNRSCIFPQLYAFSHNTTHPVERRTLCPSHSERTEPAGASSMKTDCGYRQHTRHTPPQANPHTSAGNMNNKQVYGG